MRLKLNGIEINDDDEGGGSLISQVYKAKLVPSVHGSERGVIRPDGVNAGGCRGGSGRRAVDVERIIGCAVLLLQLLLVLLLLLLLVVVVLLLLEVVPALLSRLVMVHLIL